MAPTSDHDSPRSKVAAYMLWLLWLFGFAGVQRLYAGKYVSGILYLLTWGFFGVGQLLDLALIPGMIDDRNLKQRLLQAPKHPSSPELESDRLTQKILEIAAANRGMLTVSQAVMLSGKGFKEVEAVLLEICKRGYATIENHPQTGVVIYKFPELAE